MNDTSKSVRWISYHIASTDDFVIAEADRKLGDHIKSLSVFNKAIFWCISHSHTNSNFEWHPFFPPNDAKINPLQMNNITTNSNQLDFMFF